MRSKTIHFFLMIGLLVSGVVPAGWSGARVVDIRDYARVLRIAGADTSDRCGISLETGNLIGSPPDFVDDILVGSDQALDRLRLGRVGRVDFFDGALLPSAGLIDLLTPQPVPALTIYGEALNSLFGAQVTAGDFNGDMELDVAIAGVAAPVAGNSYNGRVYLFFSNTLRSATGTLIASSADVILNGGPNDALTGFSLAAADFDADGAQDLAIGVPGASTIGGAQSGRAYVVKGRAAWPHLLDLTDSLVGSVTATAVGIRAFLGAYENDRLGESLAVGDINGDGFQDLFLGADHQDVLPTPNSTRLDVGRVHLFYGNQILSGPDYTPIDLRTTADYRFIGRGEFDLHGDSIRLFNWNGDTNPVTGRGLDDLWISAPYAEWSSPGSTEDDRGLVSMIPGSGNVFAATAQVDVTFPALVDHILVGPLAETLFGGRMEFGELLGDPGIEMAVTASRYYAGGGLSAGLVLVLTHLEADLGTPAAPLYTEDLLKTAGAFRSVQIPGEAQGDRFGLRTKLLSRGGGVSLLAVGAPQASIFARAAVGVTYLFNVDSLAFDPNAGPTPTLQPTVTFTPTPLATATPSPTGIPSIFDLDRNGSVSPADLFLFGVEWMKTGKDTLPSNP